MNDWRLMGQEQYLQNAILIKSKYENKSDAWDHEHCCFCYDTISSYDGDKNEGYHTIDEKYWVCEKCYNDFKKLFNWKIQNNSL